MRLTEFDYDYKTKDGDPIEFKITPDAEGDDNRGFRVDRIDAFVNGSHVGYIKLSYIPRERFEKWMPTIWHWKSHFGGGGGLPYEKRHVNIEELSNKDLASVIEYVLRNNSLRLPRGKQGERHKDFFNSLLREPGSWSKEVKDEVSREDLLTAIELLEKYMMKGSWGKQYKDMQEFHVDKPLVDFIRVFDGNAHNSNQLDDNSGNWRRQGIATALYVKAAKYLKSQGLKLHASGIQSDEAKHAWQNLEKMGIVEPGDRRTINASRD